MQLVITSTQEAKDNCVVHPDKHSLAARALCKRQTGFTRECEGRTCSACSALAPAISRSKAHVSGCQQTACVGLLRIFCCALTPKHGDKTIRIASRIYCIAILESAFRLSHKTARDLTCVETHVQLISFTIDVKETPVLQRLIIIADVSSRFPSQTPSAQLVIAPLEKLT